jgi:hypothetical protein
MEVVAASSAVIYRAVERRWRSQAGAGLWERELLCLRFPTRRPHGACVARKVAWSHGLVESICPHGFENPNKLPYMATLRDESQVSQAWPLAGRSAPATTAVTAAREMPFAVTFAATRTRMQMCDDA